MKCILLICILLLPAISYSQYGHRFAGEFFFGRLPNAAAAAMGKAYVSLDGDLGSITFNPAGIASIRKVEFYSTYTPPGFFHTLGYYTFNALSYRMNPYINLALSHFRFDYGKTPSNLSGDVYREKYTLTLSSEPIKNWLVGFNANYFLWREGYGHSARPFFFDFGFIKKIPLKIGHKHQIINAGASISNFTGASTANSSLGIISKFYLPIIARYGVSFKSEFGKFSILDSGSTFQYLLQSDYQMLLNSKYFSGIRLGCQITILNLLSLRAGYYQKKQDIYNLPQYNKTRSEAFTYGAGIQIPLISITNIPVKIFFDYTSLPQVNPTYIPINYPKFSTYTIRLSFQK